MKRLLSFVVMLAFGLLAQTVVGVPLNAYFNLGPLTGGVFYGDNSPVAGSEKYAVIFTADGKQFGGFTADGKLKDPAVSVVSGWASTISDITSEPSGILKWELDEEWLNDAHLAPLGCKDGYFELYLLDTRTSDGYADIDDDTGLPKTINAWTKPTGSGSVKASDLKFARSPSVSSGSLLATGTTVIGASIPQPVIVSFVNSSGVANVGATNTVATAQYVLKKATDVGFTNVIWTSAAKAGAVDKTTSLPFADESATGYAAFYRIEVVK